MTVLMQDNNGYVTALVLIMLAIMTVLGASVSRVAVTDLWISRNEGESKTNFYVAEGGNSREAREVVNGNYAIDDIYEPETIATERSAHIPHPRPHEVAGKAYDFTIRYKGMFLPPKGFSAIDFSRYDYEIETRSNEKSVIARYCIIGPKG